jgi:hypothetical protein
MSGLLSKTSNTLTFCNKSVEHKKSQIPLCDATLNADTKLSKCNKKSIIRRCTAIIKTGLRKNETCDCIIRDCSVDFCGRHTKQPSTPKNNETGCVAIVKTGPRAGQRCCNYTKTIDQYCFCHLANLLLTDDMIDNIIKKSGWTTNQFDNIRKNRLYKHVVDSNGNHNIEKSIEQTKDKILGYYVRFYNRALVRSNISHNFTKEYVKAEPRDVDATATKYIEQPQNYKKNFEVFNNRLSMVQGKDRKDTQKLKSEYLNKFKYAVNSFKKKSLLLPLKAECYHLPQNVEETLTKVKNIFSLRKQITCSRKITKYGLIPDYMYKVAINDTTFVLSAEKTSDLIQGYKDTGKISVYLEEIETGISNLPYKIARYGYIDITNGDNLKVKFKKLTLEKTHSCKLKHDDR